MKQQAQHKTALVTGGTDGIGRAIAQSLAARGIHVAIVGRDVIKGRRAEQELRAATANPHIFFHRADLSLMSECRRLSAEINDHWPVLHYLVHCAGIIRGRRELTVGGVEANFATNYLSRFELSLSFPFCRHPERRKAPPAFSSSVEQQSMGRSNLMT